MKKIIVTAALFLCAFATQAQQDTTNLTLPNLVTAGTYKLDWSKWATEAPGRKVPYIDTAKGLVVYVDEMQIKVDSIYVVRKMSASVSTGGTGRVFLSQPEELSAYSPTAKKAIPTKSILKLIFND